MISIVVLSPTLINSSTKLSTSSVPSYGHHSRAQCGHNIKTFVKMYGEHYERELAQRRKKAIYMLRLALRAAAVTINQESEIAFEWPRKAAG
jgi:hypothetical protein